MPSQEHVAQNGDSRKKFNVLIGSSDTLLGHLMGVMACNLFSIEEDLAFLRMVKSCNAIEKTCFSRAVRADDTDQLPRTHGEINIMERHHAPEVQKDLFHLQLSPS